MEYKKNLKISLGILILWLLVLAYRLFKPDDEFGWHLPENWVDYLYLFILYFYLHITAVGLGRLLVRKTSFGLSGMENALLAYMLGFGALSMIIAVLGFIGWLTPAGMFTAISISGLLSSLEWNGIFRGLLDFLKTFRVRPADSLFEKLFRILAIGTIPVLLAHALTPVWDYDALLYHLEVPRRFLEQEAFYFDPNMFRTMYPYLGEMLFFVGMVFRLDSLAKLVHLTFAILFVLSIYSFGKRFFTRNVSLAAVGVIVSVPSFMLWSTWAGIDFAWSGYELWSVYAVCLWAADKNPRSGKWMVLAGVMSGFGAATKYISIPTMLIVVLLIVWVSLQKSKWDMVGTVRNLLVFGVCAGLIMGGWYVKNIIQTGNPVYPLVFGGPGWNQLKDQILNDYVGTFGMGKGLIDFIALPYNVYAHQELFSTSSQEIIHPLLWLGFLFPFWSKLKAHRVLIVYVGVYYVWWFFGSQVIRFILPISAVLALFAGDVLERLPSVIKNTVKITLITGLMVLSLVYQTLILRNSGAFSYIAGQADKAEFLQLFVEDYEMKQFILENVDDSERVLFLWDGRGYYCDFRCMPDSEHSTAVSLALDMPLPNDLAQELKKEKVAYLMLSNIDANFAMLFHDPNKYHQRALEYYESTFLPVCTEMVFKDGAMELYRIIC